MIFVMLHWCQRFASRKDEAVSGIITRPTITICGYLWFGAVAAVVARILFASGSAYVGLPRLFGRLARSVQRHC